jgi:hypothetical protein
VDVKEQYQIKISNRFAALENLDGDFDINRTLKSIRENIKASATDSPWSNDRSSKLLDQRKQARLQCLQSQVKQVGII